MAEQSLIPNGNRCVVLYTGNMATYCYDTLLQSLVLLKETDPTKARQLHLKFVGDYMDSVKRDAFALGISEMVETSAPVSQAEIAHVHQDAHAFLILGRDPSRKGHELVAGAKLFEYLKSRRPIIGVLPRDETRRILQELGVATIADADSPPDIAALLRRIIDTWSDGSLPSLVPDPKACEIYSGERQINALVRALEGLPAEKPFVPGSVEIPPSLQREIAL